MYIYGDIKRYKLKGADYDMINVIDFEANFRKALENENVKTKIQNITAEIENLKIQLKAVRTDIVEVLENNEYRVKKHNLYNHKYAAKLPTVWHSLKDGRSYCNEKVSRGDYRVEGFIQFRLPETGRDDDFLECPNFYNEGYNYAPEKVISRCAELILNKKIDEKQLKAARSILKLARFTSTYHEICAKIKQGKEEIEAFKNSAIKAAMRGMKTDARALDVAKHAIKYENDNIAHTEGATYYNVISIIKAGETQLPADTVSFEYV